MKKGPLTRRDACYFYGRRGNTLNSEEAAAAWWFLSGYLSELGEADIPDIPKFADMLIGYRQATIEAKSRKGKLP